MDDADLMEERDAVSGLVWMGSVTSTSGSIADRYLFPNQETSVRADDKKRFTTKANELEQLWRSIQSAGL